MDQHNNNHTQRVMVVETKKDLFIVIFLWIGLWGVSDNIMDLFVSEDNYVLRGIIYAIIFIIAWIAY